MTSFAATTPQFVSKVGLRARDAEALARHYEDLLGLTRMDSRSGGIALGVEADGTTLLEIEHAPSSIPDDARTAGLFHTAFLLPSRADLARWIARASERRTRIEGASDHLVSEALYLTDPEGNGIEIYADRPKEAWPQEDGRIAMATERLDLPALMGELGPDDSGWTGAPSGTMVGHVHLRVGDPRTAETWWNDTMGFDTMVRYGHQAVFLATGGYHHHVGANSWHSAGAGPRDPKRSGLAWVEFQGRDLPAFEAMDPWGTVIRRTAG